MVERHLPKVDVASSSLVVRSSSMIMQIRAFGFYQKRVFYADCAGILYIDGVPAGRLFFIYRSLLLLFKRKPI